MTEAKSFLCFDYGTRRIGVAVGQSITHTATPLTTLPNSVDKTLWQAISQLVTQWQPNIMIVGLPCHADGSANAITLAAKEFGNQLQARYNLPVEWIDERLSSYTAEQYLQETKKSASKEDIDRYAAKFILDAWFLERGYDH